MRIWLVCCGSIRGLIISFAPNGWYCRSRFRSKRVILSLTLKERGMHIWLVYCGSIPSIISFAPNGSYCRSRLKNEVYIFGLFVVVHAFAIVVAHAFAPNGSHCRSHLKNEVYMHVWCLVGLLWQMQVSDRLLPGFKPWRTRYESVNYGISNYWST